MYALLSIVGVIYAHAVAATRSRQASVISGRDALEFVHRFHFGEKHVVCRASLLLNPLLICSVCGDEKDDCGAVASAARCTR